MAHCMKSFKEIVVILANKYGLKTQKDMIQLVSTIYGVNTSRTKLEIRRAVKAIEEE